MEEFHRESQHRVEEASARVAEALKREAELQERLASLAEENAALVMEMDHRPTSKELHDAHDKAKHRPLRLSGLVHCLSKYTRSSPSCRPLIAGRLTPPPPDGLHCLLPPRKPALCLSR